MSAGVLRRQARPDGFTEITIDVDGVHTMTVMIPTEIAHEITDEDAARILELGVSAVRGRVKR